MGIEITCCKAIELKKGVYAHQNHCVDFDESADADALDIALKGIRLGDWMDTFLEKIPPRQHLNRNEKGFLTADHVFLDPDFQNLDDDHEWKKFENSLILRIIISGVTLTFGRGFTPNPVNTSQTMSAYCVQEIEQNDERKVPRKPRPNRHK